LQKKWDEEKMWNICCMVSELFPTVTDFDVLEEAVSGKCYFCCN